MNSNFKIALVAVISFSLGVMATTFMQTQDSPINRPSQLSNLSSSQKEIDSQRRKPFFVKVKESSDQIVQKIKGNNVSETVLSSKVNPVQSQIDFIYLTEALEDFDTKSQMALRKKFATTLDDKDPVVRRNQQHLRSKLELMFMEKETNYRASFTDELTNYKVNLFFKYYPCNEGKLGPGMKFSEICYTLYMFVLQDEKLWLESNISSSLQGLLWNKDNPYIHVNLTGLWDFSKKLSAPTAVIAIPDDQSIIYYLKYYKEKFTWLEGNEIRWTVAGEKDLDKFIDWKSEFNIRHSDYPRP